MGRAAPTVRGSNAQIESKKKRGVAFLLKIIADNILDHAVVTFSLRFPASIVPLAPHVVADLLRVSTLGQGNPIARPP